MKHIRTVYGLVITSVVAPLVAFAQFGQPSFNFGQYYQTGSGFNGGMSGGIGGYQTRSNLQFNSIPSIIGLANQLLGYIQVLIFLVALFYFLWAAYSFVTGDVKGGSTRLGYAVIGIVVAILAFSIIPLVCFLTQSNGPACNL